MLPTPRRRTLASTLKAISGNESVGLLGRMQFRRAAHHTVLDIGDDHRAIASAFRGIAFDEAVIHEAVEAIMAAGRIEPQQVVA